MNKKIIFGAIGILIAIVIALSWPTSTEESVIYAKFDNVNESVSENISTIDVYFDASTSMKAYLVSDDGRFCGKISNLYRCADSINMYFLKTGNNIEPFKDRIANISNYISKFDGGDTQFDLLIPYLCQKSKRGKVCAFVTDGILYFNKNTFKGLDEFENTLAKAIGNEGNDLLGITCGLASLYFIRMMGVCEGVFARYKDKPYIKLAIGGTVLSLLIFCFPSLYGEGYSSINLLLNGRTEADWNQILNNSMWAGQGSLLLLYIALVILMKVIATSATNGGGGCGGTFAPSLFVGCFTGFFFSRIWNIYQIGVYIPEKNFALMGMAGVMSGVMHAPLTGMFLIAELTGGYNLLLPLMMVSVCSYLTIIIFEPHSIYGARLAKEGKLLTHHTDHAVLTLMNLDSVIERDYDYVSPDMELGQIVNKISHSHTSVLPVLDAAGMLLGEVEIMKIRNVMFRIELYHHFKAVQLMIEPKATLNDNTPMAEVMRTFDRTRADWLPVLDMDNHLKGYISRQRLYTLYRKMVHDMSED